MLARVFFFIAVVYACDDRHPICPKIAEKGFCTNPFYQDYRLLCQRSCNLCSDCRDSDPSCPSWQRNGFCQNMLFRQLRVKCSKSCGICDAGVCPIEQQLGPCQSGMTCPRGYVCSRFADPPVCCRV